MTRILVPPTSLRVDREYWDWFFRVFVRDQDVQTFFDRYYQTGPSNRIRISGDLSTSEDSLVCAAVYLGIPLLEVWPYETDVDVGYFS
jgi:hypothetical protein